MQVQNINQDVVENATTKKSEDTQEQAQGTKQESNQKSQLDELLARNKELEKQLAKIEADKEAKKTKELEEQGKYKELLEKLTGELENTKTELEGAAKFKSKYEDRLKIEWEKKAEGIPENFSHMFNSEIKELSDIEKNLAMYDNLVKANAFNVSKAVNINDKKPQSASKNGVDIAKSIFERFGKRYN